MDDLAHHSRKRKQDQDDPQDDQAVPVSDPSSAPAVNAPRHQWHRTPAEGAIWDDAVPPTPTTPTTPTEDEHRSHNPPRPLDLGATIRPRVPEPKRLRRREPDATISFEGLDEEEVAEYGKEDPVALPSSSQVPRNPALRVPKLDRTRPGGMRYARPPSPPPTLRLVTVHTSIDFTAKPEHIPHIYPPITRNCLRELELDVLLRQPMIRHDSLFTPSLHLRPRQRRTPVEPYWDAIWDEIRTGCTCATVDEHNQPAKVHQCVCEEHRAPDGGMVVVTLEGKNRGLVYPSRLAALLREFLSCMVFVIQPLSNTAVYTNPNAVHAQAQQHAAHASYLRSVFDPRLIEQQLKHGIFDAATLFTRIGQTLKQHCAPMRDKAVEGVVEQAHKPGAEALKAFKFGLELLELMKLDIANHQLTQLRPWILSNTPGFEMRAFRMKHGVDASLHYTHEWLSVAHKSMSNPALRLITHPSLPRPLEYQKLTQNQKTLMCVFRGLVEVIFSKDFLKAAALNILPMTKEGAAAQNLPGTLPDRNPPPPTQCSVRRASRSYDCSMPLNVTTVMLNDMPETLYLDKARLSALATEAVDATVLYMFTLLFRQLVLHNNISCKIEDSDIEALRSDLRAIGPTTLAAVFVSPEPDLNDWKSEEEYLKRKTVKKDLVLQVVSHACRVRQRRAQSTPTSPIGPSATTLTVDPALLAIAERWADTSLCPGAHISQLCYDRIREAVFTELVGTTWPKSNQSSEPDERPSFMSTEADEDGEPFVFGATRSSLPPLAPGMRPHPGLEGLSVEIKNISEALARVAEFNLLVYLPLYENRGFLTD